jgi:hypothetical protein
LKKYLGQGRNLPQLCNINNVDILALPLDAWFKLWIILKHTIINIIYRYQLHLPLPHVDNGHQYIFLLAMNLRINLYPIIRVDCQMHNIKLQWGQLIASRVETSSIVC